MTKLVLTKTKMRQGIWEGVLTGAAAGMLPSIRVTHQGNAVPHVTISVLEGGEGHALRIPVPQDAIADLMAGEALGDDLRVEVDLLRAELDMLKRAFRRHCLETS